MALCPEAAYRVSLTDAEFWDHVFNRPDPRHDEHAFGADREEVDMLTRLATPCPECGQAGACAWDAEGRPMIHITEGETNDA